jgi:hypothetical protein
MIEASVVDVGTMQSLGEMIDAALNATPPAPTPSAARHELAVDVVDRLYDIGIINENHVARAIDAILGLLPSTVSIDVSTGDDDAGNRVFGRVIDRQINADGAVCLLCEYESDNFGMRAGAPDADAKKGTPNDYSGCGHGPSLLDTLPDEAAIRQSALWVISYTNYRGETSVRRIIPKSVRFGSTEWHPEPQWLLLAWDDDKQADREFALKDFGSPEAAIRADEREKMLDKVCENLLVLSRGDESIIGTARVSLHNAAVFICGADRVKRAAAIRAAGEK